MVWPLRQKCFWVVGMLVLLVGCGVDQTSQPDAGGPLSVFAGIGPVAYLVEQIGGECVAVDVLIQPGQDPHTFEPTPRQVHALGGATLFFKVGMPFENTLVEKVRGDSRQLTIVDVANGVERRAMGAACCDHGRHDHEVLEAEADPHVWLSPPLLKVQAANVAEALCRADPAHQHQYKENLASLLERIDATHRRVERELAPHRGRAFYVFHPGFGYFADAYGLKEEAVEAGGRSPSAKQLHTLVGRARAEGVNTVFVQPQFDPRSAQTVAEAIGGNVVPIDGLAKDVLSNIEDIAKKIKRAWEKK